MLSPGINLGLTASVYSHTDTNCQGQGSMHTTRKETISEVVLCWRLSFVLFFFFKFGTENEYMHVHAWSLFGFWTRASMSAHISLLMLMCIRWKVAQGEASNAGRHLKLTSRRAGAWWVKYINHPFTVKAARPGTVGANLITPFRNLIREQLLNGKPRNS